MGENVSKPWMIYGANGYTGELIAREAVGRGLKPVLTGRTAAKVEPLAGGPQQLCGWSFDDREA
jgi:short subunit dehydrogenase-like uncharacterized protein